MSGAGRLVWLMAWRNLWRNPVRSTAFLLLAGLGIGCLIVFLGIEEGARRQMIDVAAGLGAGHASLRSCGGPLERDAVAEIGDWASELPFPGGGVTALPRWAASGLLSGPAASQGIVMMGIDPPSESRTRLPEAMTEGGFFETNDPRTILLGEVLARRLGAGPGDRLVFTAQAAGDEDLFGCAFTVEGIFRTGLEEADAYLVLAQRSTLTRAMGAEGAAHSVALLLPDCSRTDLLARRARRDFPRLEVRTWRENLPRLDAHIRMDEAGNVLFNGLFLILLGFILLNTLLASVLERRREFSLLTALGMPGPSRAAMVTIETLLLSALAVCAGAVIGGSAHLAFSRLGLPLSWFGADTFSVSGFPVDPVIRSRLDPRHLLGALALLPALSPLLSAIPCWIAWRSPRKKRVT